MLSISLCWALWCIFLFSPTTTSRFTISLWLWVDGHTFWRILSTAGQYCHGVLWITSTFWEVHWQRKWRTEPEKWNCYSMLMTYWEVVRQKSQIRILCSSVAQSCPTLCDPMNRSTPGLPVHHQLPEFTQTHVHWVGDAIQPFHPLSSPSPPAPNPSQHQSLFQWVNSSHEVAKVLEFQL